MDGIVVFSYAEDKPSRDVLVRLVERHNAKGNRAISFHLGTPEIKDGYGNIKKMCPAFLDMAKAGLYSFVLTDLDRWECPATLIRNWFFSGKTGSFPLPKEIVFRVAVREVEAWLMADKEAFANFLGIPPANFADAPDSLPDPKQFLLNAVRRKATKKTILAMLPKGNASIGPEYNDNLCEFINTCWSIDRACARSQSLRRAVAALERI